MTLFADSEKQDVQGYTSGKYMHQQLKHWTPYLAMLFSCIETKLKIHFTNNILNIYTQIMVIIFIEDCDAIQNKP